MKVIIDPAIQRYFESAKSIQKKYGALTKKLLTLLATLRSANRNQLMMMPGNPHHLRYGARDVYSVTLKHPFRCVFSINDSQDCVTILDVVDYHSHQYRIS